MPSKRWLEHLKSARAASVQAFKKKKIEASLISNPAESKIDDKLSTADTSDIKNQSGL